MSNRVNRVQMPEWLALIDWTAKVEELFDEHVWLVGSAAQGKRDYTDVDLRVQLDDDAFERWFGRIRGPYHATPRWRFLMAAIAAWGRQETGLHIDFQVTRDCVAQVQERGGTHMPITWCSEEMTEDEWAADAATWREKLDAILDQERAERSAAAPPETKP